MLTIRRMEERLLKLYEQGHLYGTVHTSIGQEVIAVGVIRALDREKDVVWSNHRGHGHFVAYCDDVEGLIAEIMGKVTGVCGGIGGTQHIHKDNFYTNGVLGGTLPCALGTAFAEKVAGSGAITTVFLGDGAMAEGVVYESLNLAALWELPVLFVMEDNAVAQTTPADLQHAGDRQRRAESFGICVETLRAEDIEKVHDLAVLSAGRVRRESKPIFLALETDRLGPHSKGDDPRTKEALDQLWSRDPLKTHRQQLETSDPERLAALEHEVRERIDRAVEQAAREKTAGAE